jgi:uroporphyrinogen III methyltransferase / synthase
LTARTSSSATTARGSKKGSAPGRVAFVGTGPGDLGLLTLRAVDVLRDATVVLTDQLVRATDIQSWCAPDVEIVQGSLDEDGQPLAHASRAKLVVDAARRASTVVRLMDGDPGSFTGLAEEAGACVKAGIPIEVVPGVSAITAVPTYAGIPLTDTKSRAVHVLTTSDADPDWSAHASADATLVVLGARDRIGDVARHLIAAGRAETTPIAVTSHGTTTAQRTIVSTLEDIAADLDAAEIEAPAIAVVGSVVALREKLSWYETKPLFGWRVLVPRTKEQAGDVSSRLRSFGAIPQEVPTIQVEPPRTPQQMERAVKGLVTGRYEWIAFTSVNAVKAVRERFEEYGLDARAFSGIKIAAVGEQTAEALRSYGVTPDLVPSGEQSAQGLLEDWPPYDEIFDPINRLFLPRADIATETLVAGLVKLGWEVDDVTAYRTVRAAPPQAEVREAIKSGGFDAVLFTSSSTVRNLIGIAGKPHPSTVIACIGQQTAKTAEEHGLRVDVLAATASTASLVSSLADFGAAQRLAALAAGESNWRPSQRRTAARRKAK